MASRSSSSSQPLLSDRNSNTYEHSQNQHPKVTAYKRAYTICRSRVKAFLSSSAQHYTVLALVSLDLLGIFADIIINLYQCDEGDTNPMWDDVRSSLGIAGLVFSCMFMLELILSVWAFGWKCVSLPHLPPPPSSRIAKYTPLSHVPRELTRNRYFNSWFHSFDAIVIVAGFTTDVLLHGVLEEVASLVVILRLWRFFKIIEEFSVGAEEQMAGLSFRIEQLESENSDLRRELKKQRGTLDEEEQIAF